MKSFPMFLKLKRAEGGVQKYVEHKAGYKTIIIEGKAVAALQSYATCFWRTVASGWSSLNTNYRFC